MGWKDAPEVKATASWANAPLVQEPTLMDSVKQGVADAVGGTLRGAGSIGATILSPVDAFARKLNSGKPVNIGGYDIVGQDRRQAMDQAMDSAGVDRNSLTYKGFKLGTEVAGTAGAGGAVSNGLLRVAPAVATVAPSAANFLTTLAPAIQSGGLTLGANAPSNALANILLRTGGGAINGATTAAMVNTDDAASGALIGGALPGAVKVAGAAGSAIKNGVTGTAKNVLGMTTGTGANSVSAAYQAGKEGSTTFLDNMRGNVPMSDVIDSAKTALGQMRLDRAAQYRQGMAGVSADKTVIDFAPIDQAVQSIKSMGNYKGQVINKNSAGVVDQIDELVNRWKTLDPTEFHTPEGLDALKQAISDIRDTTQFGTAARKAADTAYNAVKGEITTQAPTYAKVMKDYSQASETLAEIERSLSLGNKAAADTSLRKLQSLMRNNVNTNFGNRINSANVLESNGADILPAVAGQAMSSWTPRGLAGLAASGAGVASLVNPTTLIGLPAASPRLVGETAYLLGAANRGAANGVNALRAKAGSVVGLKNLPSVSMNQLSPLLATTPVISAIQR